MSMLLANLKNSRVYFRQLVTHKKTIQIRAMSVDRKRTGQGNNLNDEGNYIIYN